MYFYVQTLLKRDSKVRIFTHTWRAFVILQNESFVAYLFLINLEKCLQNVTKFSFFFFQRFTKIYLFILKNNSAF